MTLLLVGLATGLFTLEQTDLEIPDTLPIALTRTYRSRDPEVRAFGPGATHPYAMFMYSEHQYTEADLVLPDGAKLHYVRTSPGTGWTDAVFVHQETATTSATPTRFYKSIMTWNGNGWNVVVRTQERRLKLFRLAPGTRSAMRAAIMEAVDP